MSTDDERLEDLLDAWEEAFETGQDIPVAELCEDCPELAASLRNQNQPSEAAAWVPGRNGGIGFQVEG